jgi:hypothetical protein
VPRVLTLALFAGFSLAPIGCSSTWDMVSSRKFRKDPFNQAYRLWNPEDPMVILRSDPPRDGDERAKAMYRLKEPLAIGLTQQDQDEIVDMLAKTATTDASPVLRTAAIEALGRFQDQRATGILLIAYQKAHGRADGTPDPVKPGSGLQLVGGTGSRSRNLSSLVPLTGPTGFSPETVEAIRCRTLESLGRTNRPEAFIFLAAVAAGPSRKSAPEGANDREVRLAAIRGLARCRQTESVVALAQVLAMEKGKGDTALVGRAHDGLVNLTGKRLPADPAQWNEVVQAGVVIAPEPSWVNHAIEWVKKQ